MPNTLLVNLNQVLAESGFQLPDSYIGNTDQNVLQIVAIAQVVAMEIAELALEQLRSTWSLALTSATAYDLPDDWLGFVPGTMYQHGRWDRADIPTTEGTWALLGSIAGISSLPIRVRIIGNQLHIINPQAGATLNVEYFSNAPIITTDGTSHISQWLNDNETWGLDDRLFQLEVKWRFKKEKGLPDWQIDLQDAAQRRASVRSRTSGASDIVPNLVTVSGQPYANLWVT